MDRIWLWIKIGLLIVSIGIATTMFARQFTYPAQPLEYWIDTENPTIEINVE